MNPRFLHGPFGFRRVILTVMALMSTLLSPGTVRATDEVLTDEQLQARLSELKEELAQEKESWVDAQRVWSTRLEALRFRRHELADQILDIVSERGDLVRQKKTLRDQADEESPKLRKVEAQLETVLDTTRTLADKLQIYLLEIPGSARWRDRVDRIIERVNPPPGPKSSRGDSESVTELLGLFDQVHDQANTVSIREAQIRTRSGGVEEVSMLSVGHIFFAYEPADPRRVGLALSSPQDATGYRWVEFSSGSTASAIRSAFDRVRSGTHTSVSVPVDVSGRLRADHTLYRVTLPQRIWAGGPVMVPLLVVAISAVALTGERAWILYFLNRRRSRQVNLILETSKAGRHEEACGVSEKTNGTIFRTLAACLRRHHQGPRAMEESIQEQLLHELPRLQRFLGGIAILAGIAPLLGLLGTVTGIIKTFTMLRMAGHQDPSFMAGGISEALVTTAAGLIIAIPILLVHSVLSGRVDLIISDAEKHSATLLNTLSFDTRSGPDS